MTMRRFRRQRRRPAPTTDRRPPEVRLEAMIREQYDDRRLRMWDRILDEIEIEQNAAMWLAAASTLRDRLIIGDDETYHLAARLTEHALFRGPGDAELLRIGDEIEAIGRAHGLAPGAAFPEGEAPDEWLQLDAAWGARADELMSQVMRDGGLADVADAFVRQRAKFDEREEEGRRRIWGDDDPALD